MTFDLSLLLLGVCWHLLVLEGGVSLQLLEQSSDQDYAQKPAKINL